MLSQERANDLDGTPLAVCISDCQIDCGQPAPELMRLCFQVSCAFAEMRWGTQTPPLTRTAASHQSTSKTFRHSGR
jgi:hypothetical protein